MQRRSSQIVKRLHSLKGGGSGTGPVVYWMSREQRVHDNWALLAAQEEGLLRQRGVCVVFCLQTSYPFFNQRNGLFLFKGLREVQKELTRFNISFILLQGDPSHEIPRFMEQCDAAILIADFDPLRLKRRWKEQILATIRQPFCEVDAHNIIPAWITSEKREYGAYTIRPKIHRLLDEYLVEIPDLQRHPWPVREAFGVTVSSPPDISALLQKVGGYDVAVCDDIEPGEGAAIQVMENFIAAKLENYETRRNNPCLDGQSGLSPYFHFGQLSPQRVALAVRDAAVSGSAAFLEELVVRRELADNFCLYCDEYDQVSCFPEWAQLTLAAHQQDRRDYIYTYDDFAQGKTHEFLWNRCQHDLVQNGRLHGYLRMYWAKKILEWSENVETALKIAIHLNDTYALDGRDPNGYAGIAWSLGGVHDRAWPERKVFGKVRYMNESGCRRKFDVHGYIAGQKTLF